MYLHRFQFIFVGPLTSRIDVRPFVRLSAVRVRAQLLTGCPVHKCVDDTALSELLQSKHVVVVDVQTYGEPTANVRIRSDSSFTGQRK